MPLRLRHQWPSWVGSHRRNDSRPNFAAQDHHRRLRLERLEDRYLLATDLFTSAAYWRGFKRRGFQSRRTTAANCDGRWLSSYDDRL